MRRSAVGATATAVALVSAASFGMSGVFAKGLLAAGWSPGAAVTARIVGAALVLLVPVLLGLRGRWGSLRRGAWPVIGYGALGVAGAQLCYFMSLQYLPVSMALLIEYLAPVLVVLAIWGATRRRPAVLTLIGAAVAVAGLVLVLDLAGVAFHPVGVAWASAAAICNAGYFLLAGRTVDGLPPVVMAGTGIVVAAIIMLVVVATGVLPIVVTAAPVVIGGLEQPWWIPVIGLALVATVSAYLFGILAARRLGSQTASFVALTEVVFAVVFSAVLMGERPGWWQIAGGALMIAGVVLVRVAALRERLRPVLTTITDDDVPTPLPAAAVVVTS